MRLAAAEQAIRAFDVCCEKLAELPQLDTSVFGRELSNVVELNDGILEIRQELEAARDEFSASMGILCGCGVTRPQQALPKG
jgi:hypothetical protein